VLQLVLEYCVSSWKAVYNVRHTSALPVVYDELQCSVNALSLDECNVTTMMTGGRDDGTSCDAASEAAAVACIPWQPQRLHGNYYTPLQ